MAGTEVVYSRKLLPFLIPSDTLIFLFSRGAYGRCFRLKRSGAAKNIGARRGKTFKICLPSAEKQERKQL